MADEAQDPLHGFRERIRHTILLRLYDYWAERRRGRSFPSRQDIDPVELRFRFRLVGSLMAQRMGFDFTGKMVDEIADAEYRDSLIAAYRQIVESHRPSTVLYERVIDDRPRRFEVLRLPLAADGETINMLLLCPQYFEPLPERSPVATPARDRGSPMIVSEN